MQEMMDELVGLTEIRKDGFSRKIKLQLQKKHLYDKKIVARKFELDNLFLMWNARIEDKDKHRKFHPIQLGPYLVYSTWGEDS